MQNQNFRRFVAASGLTNFADGIATVAWAWLASLLTRDPLLIAIVPVALRLPWFLFAIPAGIVTDRVDRRNLILMMDAVRGLAFLAAAATIWMSLPLGAAPMSGVSNPVLFATICLTALGVGVAEVFRDNAAQTMLPAIVPHDQLENANGKLWSVELVGNALVGPAAGAFLIALYLPLPFVANAAAYLIAIFLVLRVAAKPRPTAKSRNWRVEFSEGFTYLKNAPLLRTLALVTGSWNLVFHMMLIGLVLHVQENLQLGAQAYGLILAAGAIGGVLAGFVSGRIIATLGQALTAQVMLAASAPLFICIALAPGPVTLAICLGVFEFTGLVWNTVSVSYRQRKIPDALLGRVNSLYRLLAWGMMPVGLLMSGVIVRIAENIMSRGTALLMPFVIAGIGAALLTIFGWRPIGQGFTKQD